MLRCRLRTGWSLLAQLTFFALTCFDLVVIGFAWRSLWEIWFLLLTMPAFAWFVRRHEHDLQRLIAALLDDVANRAGIKKVS